MQVHKQLKKKIEDNKLISSLDLLRSCNTHGFTDLSFSKLDLTLNPESKYLIAINIDNKPKILYHPDFYNLRQEIDEKMIKKTYYGGYDLLRNRVLIHHLGDGKCRIGNKKGIDEFTTQFEECNFNLLAKRNNAEAFIKFLSNDEKHRALQVLIAELGISLGYKVKIANNDKTNILKQDYIEPDIEHDLISIDDIEADIEYDLTSIDDIQLANIQRLKSKDNINLIDVIWYDNNSKCIVAAFEVELSRNYDALLRRLGPLIKLPYLPYLICVGVAKDYKVFKRSALDPYFYKDFKNTKLKYLRLEDLYKILDHNKIYNISGKPSLSTHTLLDRNLINVL